MSAETKPPKETPRPQENALQLFLTIKRLHDDVAELHEMGNFDTVVFNLDNEIRKAESLGLARMTSSEKSEYKRLGDFATDISVGPHSVTEIVKSLMEVQEYTRNEINRFLRNVLPRKKSSRSHRI